jgi:hypothetical protein
MQRRRLKLLSGLSGAMYQKQSPYIVLVLVDTAKVLTRPTSAKGHQCRITPALTHVLSQHLCQQRTFATGPFQRPFRRTRAEGVS